MRSSISNTITQAGVFILLLGLLSSCHTLYYKAFGIQFYDFSHPYNDSVVIAESTKYFGDAAAIGSMDTTYLETLYLMPDTAFTHTSSKGFMKVMSQPLNAVWFNRQKALYALVANCDADNKGLVKVNLTWQYYLHSFPIDSNLSFKTQFSADDFAKQVRIVRPGINHSDTVQYYVYILWSQFMGRQYQNFLREWGNYFRQYTGAQVVVVNMDQVWARATRKDY